MATRLSIRLSAINPNDVPNADHIDISTYSQRKSTPGYSFSKSGKQIPSAEQKQHHHHSPHPFLSNSTKGVRKAKRDVALREAVIYVKDIINAVNKSHTTDDSTRTQEVEKGKEEEEGGSDDDSLSELLKNLTILRRDTQDILVSKNILDEKYKSLQIKYKNDTKDLSDKTVETALNNMRFALIDEKNKMTSAQLRLDDNDNYVKGVKRHHVEEINDLLNKIASLQSQIDRKNNQILEIPTIEERYLREARRMVAEKSVEVALKDIEMKNKLSELDELVYWRNRCKAFEEKAKDMDEEVKLIRRQNRSNVSYFQKTFYEMLSRPSSEIPSPGRVSPEPTFVFEGATSADNNATVTDIVGKTLPSSANTKSTPKVFSATNTLISQFPEVHRKQKATQLLEDEIRSLKRTNIELLSKCNKLSRLLSRAREAPLRHMKYSEADVDDKSVEFNKKPQHVVDFFDFDEEINSVLELDDFFLSEHNETIRESRRREIEGLSKSVKVRKMINTRR